MKLTLRISRWLSAIMLRQKVKRDRKARGLSPNLRFVIAKYREVSTEYADALEDVLYPKW